MFEFNFLAIIASAVAAFVIGAIWNSVLFGNTIMKLRDPDWNLHVDNTKTPFWKLLIEFVRCFTIAFVLAHFVVQLSVDGWMGVLQIGSLLWIGFPVMILVGAVIWENEPWKLAMIHAGDWLLKLIVMTGILSAWL